MQASRITVKASLASDLRRFTITSNTSLEGLKSTLVARFNTNSPFVIKWIDEEADAITIADDEDLTAAVAECNGKLRLHVVTQETNPQPTTQTSASTILHDTSLANAALRMAPLLTQITKAVEQIKPHMEGMIQGAAAQCEITCGNHSAALLDNVKQIADKMRPQIKNIADEGVARSAPLLHQISDMVQEMKPHIEQAVAQVQPHIAQASEQLIAGANSSAEAYATKQHHFPACTVQDALEQISVAQTDLSASVMAAIQQAVIENAQAVEKAESQDDAKIATEADVVHRKKVAYIGSPQNLKNEDFMKAITALICELEQQNVDVYVGNPNAALCDCSNALVENMAVSDVMFDAVLVTPGGPGTQNEAQLFHEAGVPILTFCNSADAQFGNPPWFSNLSSRQDSFDLLSMTTQDAIDTVISSFVDAEPEYIAEDMVNATTEAEAEAAVEAEGKAATDENTALLVSMGFSEPAVVEALEATHGSLEHAADWLFVHATDYPLHEVHAVVEPEETRVPGRDRVPVTSSRMARASA